MTITISLTAEERERYRKLRAWHNSELQSNLDRRKYLRKKISQIDKLMEEN